MEEYKLMAMAIICATVCHVATLIYKYKTKV